MVIAGAPGRTDIIGVTKLSANPLEKTAGETAPKDVRGHFQRWIILVAQHSAHMTHFEKRLRHVLFGSQKSSGNRSLLYFGEFWNGRLLHVPVREQLA